MSYDVLGRGYSSTRATDPRIAAAIWNALGEARTVVNVGAGSGSYEPPDREVTAVEPSEVMIAQRPREAEPAVQASAEALPFGDDAFDAAMAVLTLHHWADWRTGLAEMRRVARDRVVVLGSELRRPAVGQRRVLPRADRRGRPRLSEPRGPGRRAAGDERRACADPPRLPRRLLRRPLAPS